MNPIKFTELICSDKALLPWLGKTSKMLRMFMKVNFANHGFDLTHEQFMLIAHLYRADGIAQKDLAFITDRNKGSMARLLSTAEKKNLVTRVSGKEDKRINRVYLTEEGRAVVKELKPILESCQAQLQNGLTEEEISSMISILKKIQHNIS